MIDTSNSLSMKRNRSKSLLVKKESRFHIILRNLTELLCYKSKEKHNRKCSLGMFFYFLRSSEDSSIDDDTMFEIRNYKKQKLIRDDLPLSVYPRCDNALIPRPKPQSTVSNDSIHQNHIYPKVYTSNQKAYYGQTPWDLASSLTVQSENLSAKEFADLTGISILSEEYDLSIPPNHLSGISSTSSHHLPQLNINRIWDANFWKTPKHNYPLTLQPYRIEPPPILTELKLHHKNLSQETFIKRGRFEIQLYANNPQIIEHNTPPRKPETVIEWKRKSRIANV